MPSGYIPIFIFLAIAICFPVVAIMAAKLIRPSAPFAVKLEAYECGIKAASDSRGRYTVRFYIVAILFVIFDVETIFLFPFAVRYRNFGWFGVGEIAVFLIILAVALLFPIVCLAAAKLVRPSAPSQTKLEAYECGIKAASDSRGRYTVRFYIIAILFVIFDVETIFLFPWAVRYRQLQWFGVAEVALFLVILAVGYIWAYKKGALEWV